MSATPDIPVGRRLLTDLARVPEWFWDIAMTGLILFWVLDGGTAGTSDWTYYESGQSLLFDGDGLRLYADHPIYQIGPIALLVARGLVLLPGDAHVWCAVLTAALLVPVLGLARALVRRVRAGTSRGDVIGRIAVGLGWFPLVAIGQFGDALALLAALGAMILLVDRRPVWAGVLFSLGCAAKPWTLVLLPVLLFAPSSLRLRALVAAAVVGIAAWAPFMLASPGTLAAGQPTYVVPPDAWQRLLGVGDTPPAAWRALQLMICWTGGALMWVRSRRSADWAMGMIAAGGVLAIVRLMTDLATWPYYLSVALPLVWVADRSLAAGALPLPTLLAFVPVLALGDLLGDLAASVMRLALLLLALALLVRRWLRAEGPVNAAGGRPGRGRTAWRGAWTAGPSG